MYTNFAAYFLDYILLHSISCSVIHIDKITASSKKISLGKNNLPHVNIGKLWSNVILICFITSMDMKCCPVKFSVGYLDVITLSIINEFWKFAISAFTYQS